MLLLNIAIIYIACGAPFVVFSLSGASAKRQRILSAATALLFWPLTIVRSDPRVTFGSTEARLQELIAGMECSFSEAFPVSEFYEFREVLARYESLARAGRTAASYRQTMSIAGHPSPNVASRCLERRRQRRVDLHLAAARRELVSLIGNAPTDVAQNASALAVLLNDDHLAASLESMLAGRASNALSAAAA